MDCFFYGWDLADQRYGWVVPWHCWPVLSLSARWGEYFFTSDRVVIRNGYTGRVIQSLDIKNISEILIKQGPIGKFFDVGTLLIRSSSREQLLTFRGNSRSCSHQVSHRRTETLSDKILTKPVTFIGSFLVFRRHRALMYPPKIDREFSIMPGCRL